MGARGEAEFGEAGAEVDGDWFELCSGGESWGGSGGRVGVCVMRATEEEEGW